MSLKILVAVSSALEIPMWQKVIGEVYGECASLSDVHYVSNAQRLTQEISNNINNPYNLLIMSNDIEGAHGVTLLETLKLTRQIDFRTYTIVSTNLPESAFYSKDVVSAPDMLISYPANANMLRAKLKEAKRHILTNSKVRSQVASGDYANAIATLESDETGDLWKYEVLTFLFGATGQGEKAIAMLKALTKKKTNSDRLTLALVRQLCSAGDYDGIIDLLSGKERNGDSLLCYLYCLSMCFEEKGDLASASYYLQRAEKLTHALPEQKLFASLLYEKSGEFERAIKSQLSVIQASIGTHIHDIKHYNRLNDIACKYWNNSTESRASAGILSLVSRTLSEGSRFFNSHILALQSDIFKAHIYQLKGDQKAVDELLTKLLAEQQELLADNPGALIEIMTILNLSSPNVEILELIGSNFNLERLNCVGRENNASQLNRMVKKAEALLDESEINDAEFLFLRVVTNSPKHVPANIGLMCIYTGLYKSTGNVSHLESAYRFMESIHPIDARHIQFSKYQEMRCLIQEYAVEQQSC